MRKEKLIEEIKKMKKQLSQEEFVHWLFKEIEDIIGFSEAELIHVLRIAKKCNFSDELIIYATVQYFAYHWEHYED